MDPSTAAGAAVPRAGLPSALRHDLSKGAEALSIRLGDEKTAKLLDYLDLLVRWNQVYNLTAVRDPADMLAVHLLDALSIARLVVSTRPRFVVDVGTGAGLPGIPLAICMHRVRFALVDAVGKKTAFVQHAIGALGLSNVDVHHSRVEALTLAETPDLIVSRAFASIRDMLVAIESVAGPRTRVIAMKGVVPTDELAAVPDTWRTAAIEPLDVPMLGAARCAIVFERVAPLRAT